MIIILVSELPSSRCACVYILMQSVGLASSVPTASSHVTVQVEGHVTPGRESAASDVLQASTGMSVTSVRQKLFQLNVHQILNLPH